MRINTMNRKSSLLVIAFVLTMLCQHAWAQPRNPFRQRPEDKTNGFKDNPKMIAAFHDAMAAPSKSVVRVQCNGKNVALGTIVDADGWILTKHSELLAGATPTVLLKDGRSIAAKVAGVEPKYDLAMLKIEAKDLTAIQWAQNKSALVGELLASPGSAGDAVAVGVLSVAARSVRSRDLPVSTPPADSGFLGVGLEEAEGGARIIQVVGNSAAVRAGLRVGDIVTLIAETPIIDSETMVNTIQQHKPGEVLDIKIKRGNQEIKVKATLDKRLPEQQNKRDFQNSMGSELSNRRGGFPQILQHDMVLKPSDCGGPVVDLDGKALGINIARAGRVESYAIPAEAVQGLIDDFKNGKLAVKEPATTKPASKPAAAAAK